MHCAGCMPAVEQLALAKYFTNVIIYGVVIGPAASSAK